MVKKVSRYRLSQKLSKYRYIQKVSKLQIHSKVLNQKVSRNTDTFKNLNLKYLNTVKLKNI